MNASCCAAAHNRPSVVSPQLAGALPRTAAHMLSISAATGRCCPSHCRMESFEAPDRSPGARVLCLLHYRATRLRTFEHPTIPIVAVRPATAAMNLTGDSSHLPFNGFPA